MAQASLAGWTGLLKWSLAYQDGTGDTPVEPMPEDKKKFLQEAIEQHMVDPAKELQGLITVIATPRKSAKAADNDDDDDDNKTGGDDKEDSTKYVESKVEALRHILEFVEQIDWARDFVKMDGLNALVPMFEEPEVDLRTGALEVLAMTVQNNPYTQDAAMGLDLLSKLMDILAKENLDQVEHAKVLFAVSSLVRDHTKASVDFVKKHKGVAALLKIIHSDESAVGIRTQRKALFLLRYFLNTVPAIRIAIADRLVDTLLVSVASSDIDLREHSLHLLLAVFRDHNAVGRLEQSHVAATKEVMAKVKQDFKDDESTCKMVSEMETCIQGAPPAPAAQGDEAPQMMLENK